MMMMIKVRRVVGKEKLNQTLWGFIHIYILHKLNAPTW